MSSQHTPGEGTVDVEALLSDALIPVDPNPRFAKRLRARLVNYRGGRPFSGWTAIVVVASVVLLVASLVGFILRFLSAWVRLLGSLAERQRALG